MLPVLFLHVFPHPSKINKFTNSVRGTVHDNRELTRTSLGDVELCGLESRGWEVTIQINVD